MLPAGLLHLQRFLWSLVVHAPWIAAAAVLGEGIQHVVEFQFGMYVRNDGISAGWETNVRAMAAAIKVAGFLATLWMVNRYTRTLYKKGKAGAPRTNWSTAAVAIALPIAAHYALNYRAVGQPALLVVPMLAIDSLVIGWLALSIAIALPRSTAANLRS